MLAIIPARGGSKGLPGKNIRPLLGKPLIGYTIEAAKNSGLFTTILVSTDSEEIAAVSRSFGAWVPELRPAALSSDDSKAIDVYKYVLRFVETHTNEPVETFVVLQPTSPLRDEHDIKKACQLYNRRQADSVISFTEESHPVYWHKKIDEDGRISDLFETDMLNNRQAFQKTYYPNGAIYILKKSLLEKGTYYTENTFAFVMPRTKAVDIDSIEDFEYATFLMQKKLDGE